ncbi:hypothetical protein M4951_16750 [Blastopirellula sp. J2-11]|uniref:LysM peptidoglycan-binding domain-containing protein n=1 Tax=Blastopirellula sp. J2-11 TaxID=2943192 RepID=UPI0021C6D39F|nr:hypothetical protein [Blastopirellula sp. J2-11]UUO05028.1 hypothetical protein M4951_16750 [Blastopirellula sp. J2-11]
MRREARIGFAIVGCLAAVLTYAAVKRMWMLAQVSSNPSPAPTVPAAAISAPSALAASDHSTAPVITLPSEPTSTAVYQEPVAVSRGVPFPSRFAIPLTNREATAVAEQVTTAVAAKDEPEPTTEPVDTTPIEAAPPLGRFSSRFSPAAPPTEETQPEPAEVATEAAPKPATSMVSAAIGAIASRFSGGTAPVETPAPSEAKPSEPSKPAPVEIVGAPSQSADPVASLRFVGEKTSAKPAETPPQARLIKPAPVVETKPLSPSPVAAKPSRPAWKATEAVIEPQQPIAVKSRPQPRLNRAFASTASASIPSTYVPAQNASTTQSVTADQVTPQRLPPTIEVATDTEKGVTQEADPDWVQQIITSGSFIPGQRIVPTQSPQPLPKTGQSSAQPLVNPAPAVQPAATAPHTYQVKPGDDLATIARQTLGDAARWGELFRLNRDVIGDYPDQMKPGMQLRLPRD